MELKEYRLERLRSACAEAGADMIVATLPANLNYITTGYVCVNQDVLTRAECAIGYIPAKDKYVYIVGYAELPTVFEFAGLDTEVHFYGGAFCFENGDKGNPFVEKIRRRPIRPAPMLGTRRSARIFPRAPRLRSTKAAFLPAS